MPDISSKKDTQEFSNFLRDLSIELKSEGFDDMRQRLLAYDRVDKVLDSLIEEYEVQVYRGANVVEEYRKSRAEEPPTTQDTLDYILRKDNVEIQIEVKFPHETDFSVDNQIMQRYHSLLGTNSKTEEIILVWPTERLDSTAFDLDDIKYYLFQWNKKLKPIKIEEEKIKPLKHTVIAALSKHRRSFQEPTAIREMRRIEFDVTDAFNNILDIKFNELKRSAERKRSYERIQAIRSISKVDKDMIRKLFVDAQIRDQKIDDLKKQLESISENVILD